MRKQMTNNSAEWPMGIRMTERLSRAIGVLQDASKNGEELFMRQVRTCRRYAKKFDWSDAYLSEAVEWCAYEAARAVVEAQRRHEHIRDMNAFLESRLAQALRRDMDGRVFIPRYRTEWRTGSATNVSYSDTPLKVKAPFTQPLCHND